MSILVPYNKNNKLFTRNDIQNILKKYNVFKNIQNIELYQTAMTHTSYTIPYVKSIIERDNVELGEKSTGCIDLLKKSYESLEYLGDSVIELIISNYLYNRYPNENEDFMSKLKVCFVNRLTLSKISTVIGLDKWLILSKTEEKEKGRFKISYLEDVFEAFVGAIFLDFNTINSDGYNIAEQFLINIIENEQTGLDITEFIQDDGNYKTKLIKYIKDVYKSSVSFKTIDICIEENKYTCNVIRDDTKEIIGTGIGVDNKHSQQLACFDALKNLNVLIK